MVLPFLRIPWGLGYFGYYGGFCTDARGNVSGLQSLGDMCRDAETIADVIGLGPSRPALMIRSTVRLHPLAYHQ